MDNTEMLKSIELQLAVQFSEDYLDFIGKHDFEDFNYFFRVDEWCFWGLKTVLLKNQHLRQKGMIGPNDFAFASTGRADEEVLFFKSSNGQLGLHIYHFNQENDYRDVMFYAFSISEIINFKVREKLVKGIGKNVWKKQDLGPIMDCPGSLYWYAHSLKTSEYDGNFSEARNERALELFHTVAGHGHPEATSDIASHFYFQEDTDEQKVIEWRERAIALGMIDDAFELAEFILDNQLLEMRGRAIELLEALLEKPRYHERALVRLSRVYMRGLGGEPNFSKGIELAEKGANLGYCLCTSDLALYHYKGIGLPQDTRKAYDLLLEAERLSAKAGVGGLLEPFLTKLAAELGEN